MDTWQIGLAASSSLLFKGIFDVFSHLLNGLWKFLDCFFLQPSPFGLLLRLMVSPQRGEKQKPNHRTAASRYFFHSLKPHFQSSVLSESLVVGFVSGKMQDRVCAKERKTMSLERQQVSLGASAKVPSVASQPQNTVVCLGGSPTFPETRRQRLFQRVTEEKSKLKLEL